MADAITNNGGCYCGDTTVRAKNHQIRSWPVIALTAKTLFMIRTGCLDQRHELSPPNISLAKQRLIGLARLLIRQGLPKGQQAAP